MCSYIYTKQNYTQNYSMHTKVMRPVGSSSEIAACDKMFDIS